MCARPTPEWQKGISSFLKKLPEKENGTEETPPETIDDSEALEVAEAAASSAEYSNYFLF